MVFVAEHGVSEDDDLIEWLRRGLDFAGALPVK
jgi:hypothetical protein